MEIDETIAYCGLFCGGCANYREHMNCRGCRLDDDLVGDCPTRACAIARGLLHCGECDDYPCQILTAFYQDGIPHHALARESMEELRRVGPDAWFRKQLVEHTCSCGSRVLWLSTTCQRGCPRQSAIRPGGD